MKFGFLLFPALLGAVSLDRVAVTATYECIGVRAHITDDDGSELRIRYRAKGDSDWREGHPLIRIRGGRAATSLFWLAEGRQYDIELYGPSLAPQRYSVRTRQSEIPDGTRKLWVDAAAEPDGDGSSERPFRTIQAAADAARPGTTIRVRAGVYREMVRPRISGTPEAYIRFEAEPGAKLDGGESLDTSQGWKDEADGVWSRPFNRRPRYASLDGIRLYRQSSVANLRNRGDGIDGGFTVQDGVLYVKAPDGRAITGLELKLAELSSGFLLEGRSYIAIDGFDIGWYDARAIDVRDSDHNVVKRSNVHDAPDMILVRGAGSTDNLVENNRVYGTGAPDWPWEICHHDHDCGSNAISVSGAGIANVVRRNDISGTYNGIYVGGWVQDYPEEWALENDVYENKISLIKDDAIEPECHAINLRIFRNRMSNLFVGISLAPIETGPTWVMYNTFDTPRGHDKGRGQWLKISLNPKGEIAQGVIRVYHNTSVYNDSGHTGWSSVGSGNTFIVNNVVVATSYVFTHSGSAPFPEGNWWDYNNLYTTDVNRYVRWEGRDWSLQAFRDRVGFQRNGIASPPAFRNADRGRFELLPGDPGIDKALPLPGINDGWQGAGPDMGAFESSVAN